MRSEKTVRCMRDKLLEQQGATLNIDYARFLGHTLDSLNWVLGE